MDCSPRKFGTKVSRSNHGNVLNEPVFYLIKFILSQGELRSASCSLSNRFPSWGRQRRENGFWRFKMFSL